MQRFRDQLILFVLFAIVCGGNPLGAATKPNSIRVATFNVSLNRAEAGRLYKDLNAGDTQARAVARIIQHVRPDILLLNEFDFDPELKSVRLFLDDYLGTPQSGTSAITYPYFYSSAVNTGIPSGFDLDKDGKMSGPGDAFGYGLFPGQYGMVLLSKYPIQLETVRTFQHFLWKDMPKALLPESFFHDGNKVGWYSEEELGVFRLSSKSHWDIPIRVPNQTLHILTSHPTPPVFDGPEDRNGKRNHDEIRFWADYVAPEASGYIYDDNGHRGGLAHGEYFVILGDLNADPFDGDTTQKAINQLLLHQRIFDSKPQSKGAKQASLNQQGSNAAHKGRPEYDTYQSPPGKAPGNLRLDYVLPSVNMSIVNAGVFWPPKEHPMSKIIEVTDHHMVYVDVQIDGSD